MEKKKLSNEKIIILALVSATITVLLLNFLFPLCKVDGHSMDPTLYDSQLVLSRRTKELKNNDVIIFYEPHLQKKLVKRVIAKPGDTICIKDSVVTVNGSVLNETYINEKVFEGDLETTVPEDKYFVMGDNRNHSTDSRAFGYVDKENVIGRLFTVFLDEK